MNRRDAHTSLRPFVRRIFEATKVGSTDRDAVARMARGIPE